MLVCIPCSRDGYPGFHALCSRFPMGLTALVIASSSVFVSKSAIRWGEFMGEVVWHVGLPDASGVVEWRKIERVVVVHWSRRVVQLVVAPCWRAAEWIPTPPANDGVSTLQPEIDICGPRQCVQLTTSLAGCSRHSRTPASDIASQSRLMELRCSPSPEAHRSIWQPIGRERLLEGTTCSLHDRCYNWGGG